MSVEEVTIELAVVTGLITVVELLDPIAREEDGTVESVEATGGTDGVVVVAEEEVVVDAVVVAVVVVVVVVVVLVLVLVVVLPVLLESVVLVDVLVVVDVCVVVVGTAKLDGTIVLTALHPAAPTSSYSSDVLVKSAKSIVNT